MRRRQVEASVVPAAVSPVLLKAQLRRLEQAAGVWLGGCLGLGRAASVWAPPFL